MNIPASITDLTPPWLTAVLREQANPAMASVLDVSMTPLGGAEPSARASITEALIPVYHETLVEHGVTDYALDDVWHDYRLAVLVRFPGPITNLIGTCRAIGLGPHCRESAVRGRAGGRRPATAQRGVRKTAAWP